MNNWLQQSDKIWIRETGSISDPFDPSLVHDALVDPIGFRSVVFGWDTIGLTAPNDDTISQLFIGVDGEFDS